MPRLQALNKGEENQNYNNIIYEDKVFYMQLQWHYREQALGQQVWLDHKQASGYFFMTSGKATSL